MTTPSFTTEKAWTDYCRDTLATVMPTLKQFGFALDDKQVHIGGERYIMSPTKLVLVGHHEDKRVVIKVSDNIAGTAEIDRERECRTLIDKIPFAYKTFLTPRELLYTKTGPFTIFVTEFIEQESTFIERPFTEQFFIALRSFETQESVHATTTGHRQVVESTFGMMSSTTYQAKMAGYIANTLRITESDTEYRKYSPVLTRAASVFADGHHIVDLYTGFLTHADFVPHNIRVHGRDIYLLDHSSIYFGNKYDGWARFINFMILYHRDLEHALVEYVKDNRTPEESESLRLMRIYRLTELIHYYAERSTRSQEDLLTLDKIRITFWTKVLDALLNENSFPEGVIAEYQQQRDSLRSNEEKDRQKILH